MSAFCGRSSRVIRGQTACHGVPPSITARPSVVEKMRFKALALRSGVSESALALVAIRNFLGPDGEKSETPTAMERIAATDRITIRLRPGDGAAIARHAAVRGMKAPGYLSALVRAHVRGTPPLPHAELAALKSSMMVLAELGQIFDECGSLNAFLAASPRAIPCLRPNRGNDPSRRLRGTAPSFAQRL